MFVRYALLGDAVNRTSGKWNLIGNFNVIWARTLPTNHPEMGILVRLEADHREAGAHSLQLDFVDETGARLSGPDPVPFDLAEPPVAGFPLSFDIGLDIRNLEIPKAGNYDFVVRVDGVYLDSVPLYVRAIADHPGGKAK